MRIPFSVKEPFIKSLLWLWLFCAFLLSADFLTNGPLYGDVDDGMRHAQIKTLVESGKWYDPVIKGIAMPQDYVSPWSRLVDAPYAVLTWALEPALGLDKALQMAELIVPLLLLIPFTIFLCKIIVILGRRSVGPAAWLITLMFGFMAFLEFVPSRIDHHNFQFLLMMMMSWALVSKYKYSGYVFATGFVLSLVIGLECLPYMLVMLGGLAVLGLSGDQGSQKRLFQAGQVFCILPAALGLLTLGPNLFTVQCDSFSLPWMSGLTGAGVLMTFIFGPGISRRGAGRSAILLGLAGGMWLAVCAVQYPQCLQGPYQMIDDLSRTYWLDRVAQENSMFWYFKQPGFLPISVLFLWLCATFSALCVLVARKKIKLSPDQSLLLVTALTACALSFYQQRHAKFFILFALPFIPLLWHCAMDSYGAHKKTVWSLTGFAVAISLALPLVSQRFISDIDRNGDLIYFMGSDDCDDADMSVLDGLTPGIIAAPTGLSNSLLAAQSRHQVAAISFHRAAPGLRRIYQIFGKSSPEERASASAPFDYIAVCRLDTAGYDPAPAPLYAALSMGKTWPGLTEIPASAPSRFRIYRIDHDLFR